MHSMQLRRFSRHHLLWLVLLLLLPLAQGAASWHVLSHTQSNQLAESSDSKAIHLNHCDLCLSAAALIGGAPLAESMQLPTSGTPQAAPLAVRRDSVLTPPALAYDSRAPPLRRS
jgi:hypothetical protein